MAAGPREAGVSEGTAQRRTGLAQGRGVQRARPGVLCPVAVPGQRQLPPLTANGTGPRGERNRPPVPNGTGARPRGKQNRPPSQILLIHPHPLGGKLQRLTDKLPAVPLVVAGKR